MNTNDYQDSLASDNQEDIRWEIDVPIFSNSVIVGELAIALGIPFGVLTFFLIAIGGGNFLGSGAAYALGLIALVFLLTYILIMVVYGGKYAASYIVSDKGILNYTQSKQSRKNKIINILLIVLGLLSRRPTAVGVGLLAQSRQSVFIKWSKVKKVDFNRKTKTIVIRGGFAEKIAIFCTDENYSDVSAFVMSRLRDRKKL